MGPALSIEKAGIGPGRTGSSIWTFSHYVVDLGHSGLGQYGPYPYS